ncbi:MAG: acyltransferase family protein [Acidimicrobiales bacterium]
MYSAAPQAQTPAGAAQEGKPGAAQEGRWRAFDGLRGAAIIMVLLNHSRLRWAAGAWTAVDIYFALSGFLITWLLLREWDRYGKISIARFWQRRSLRLLPVLLVVLAGTAIAVSAVPQPTRGQTVAGLPTSLFFVSNLYTVTTGKVIGLLTPTWSLGIEAQFYLLWPLLLIGMLRLRLTRTQLLAATLSLAAVSAALGPLLWSSPSHAMRIYEDPAVRGLALLLGCAAAIIYASPLGDQARRRYQVLGITALASSVVILALLATPFDHAGIWKGGGLVLIDLASATIVLGLAVGRVPILDRVLCTRLAVWLGAISYDLYLVQYPIFLGLWHTNLSLAITGAHWAISIAAATALHYLVEVPFLKRKVRHARVPDLISGSLPTGEVIPVVVAA